MSSCDVYRTRPICLRLVHQQDRRGRGNLGHTDDVEAAPVDLDKAVQDIAQGTLIQHHARKTSANVLVTKTTVNPVRSFCLMCSSMLTKH